MKLSHVSIYFATVYDDAMVSTYLTIRRIFSKEMKISSQAIYNSAILYTIGFLFGGIVANIIIKRVSSSKMLLLSQVFLLVSTVIFLFCRWISLIFIIRYLQGFLISFCLVSINTLLKQNFSQLEFNRFLAISAIFNCVVEGLIPVISSFLSESYGFRASIGLMIFIIIVSMMIYFLRFTDKEPKASSLEEAVKITFTSYKNIISSYLVILLLLVAITEGFIDIVLHLLDDMLININISEKIQKNIVPITMSLISILGSIGVNIISIFEKEEEEKRDSIFNWQYISDKDKSILMKMLLFVILIICSQVILGNSLSYKMLIFSIICVTTCMYIINYIGCKMIYSIYYNPGCVVSSIALFESGVSTIMQFFSFSLIQLKNNRLVFIYFMFFVILILFLTEYFYFSTNGLSKTSQEKTKKILPF